MPITYSSILEEHKAVRTAVGMFDLSHMGQLLVRGDDAPVWLDGLTSNEVATMQHNQARYNIVTNASGGAHDDVVIYRLPGYWLIVANAANTEKIWNLLENARPSGVTLENRTSRSCLVALQGPRAIDTLQPVCDVNVVDLKYYYATSATVGGARVEVARTGYTGEDGFEVFGSAETAEQLWKAFTNAGQTFGILPAGLGARDVLRLEAGMPLYGHELDENITPLQAGLGRAVKLAKTEFTGKTALEKQRADDAYDRIVGLMMEGKTPARAGYGVLHEGKHVGEVRSGSPAPALGGKNIATALIRKNASVPGTRLTVEIRGAQHAATVVPMPFYKRKKSEA
jgi:aminomethyltransferase